MNKYKNITASTLIKTGSGTIEGVIINSHSSGTLKLWDAVSAAVPVICNTHTLTEGERYIPLFGISFNIGLYATIGGTADVTIVYR